MRVLLAGQTYPLPWSPAVNGPGVFTRRLAEGLAAAGHEVSALLPSERGRGYVARQRGVRVRGVPAVPLAPARGVWVAAPPSRTLARLVGGRRPDVVHLQDHYPLSRSVLRWARRLGIPVVATNHFTPSTVLLQLPPLGPARALAERALWALLLAALRRADAVTAPTRAAARELRDAGLRAKVEVISCGVEVERFAGPPVADRAAVRAGLGIGPAEPVALYLGRLDRDKSVEVLVRAQALLPRGSGRLVLAGAGADAARLRGLAARLGLGGEVVFTGRVEDAAVPPLLHAADAFAMPGRIELQSIATLEAMAAGLPVVAAAAGALPELVEEGREGLLFTAGDPRSAARALARLLGAPALRARLAAAAREKAAAHDLRRTVARFADLYSSVLARAEGRRAEVGRPA